MFKLFFHHFSFCMPPFFRYFYFIVPTSLDMDLKKIFGILLTSSNTEANILINAIKVIIELCMYVHSKHLIKKESDI